MCTYSPAGERIYVRDAVRIYSFFESILEACVDSIKIYVGKDSSVWRRDGFLYGSRK